MPYLSTFVALATIWALVVISPGPCFVAVVQQTTRGTRRHGVLTASGIAVGTIVWCLGSLLGLALLFTTFSWLYNIVRFAGAAYLLYLGIQTIRHARRPLSTQSTDMSVLSGWSAWRTGLLTNISNPKAAVFFGSLFAALLPASAPLWVIIVAVSLVVAIEFSWYCVAAYFFGLPTVARLYRRTKRWIDYITGGVYILLSGRLAFVK
jgi:threonine efflux protein